ncbi:MAG: hypothetical protein QW179_01405 [Candidatus Hadarchaeales archaeon]
MLEKILGTSGKISLLRSMLTGGKESFSLNELARMSGLSTSTAFKEIRDLLDVVVDYNSSTKKYAVKESPLSKAMREIFELEKKMVKEAGATVFDLLSGLGSYYVSGTSAIILRGLARDFTASTNSLMIICDRKVSKSRGAILSFFPSYNILLLEEKIRPADFSEGEVYFEGRVVNTNLATLEKAVVDALWKPRWEGENISYAIYCLLEQPLDTELLKRYAKEKGPKVEERLTGVMEIITRATGASWDLKGLRARRGLEKSLGIKVEEAIERVLRS